MTLRDFLTTLSSPNVVASIFDSDGKTLLSEIKASTYASLEEELEIRKIASWSIITATKIQIVLKEIESEEEENNG